MPVTNTGQTVTVETVTTALSPFHCQYHPYYTSNMADAASGSADKSVQVKLVLLGALSESLINQSGS